jgi:hypothetical protein
VSSSNCNSSRMWKFLKQQWPPINLTNNNAQPPNNTVSSVRHFLPQATRKPQFFAPDLQVMNPMGIHWGVLLSLLWCHTNGRSVEDHRPLAVNKHLHVCLNASLLESKYVCPIEVYCKACPNEVYSKAIICPDEVYTKTSTRPDEVHSKASISSCHIIDVYSKEST